MEPNGSHSRMTVERKRNVNLLLVPTVRALQKAVALAVVDVKSSFATNFTPFHQPDVQ